MTKYQQEEWDAWLRLCNALESVGAVTTVDLKAKSSDEATPGQRLFHSIREWGEAYAVLQANAAAATEAD